MYEGCVYRDLKYFAEWSWKRKGNSWSFLTVIFITKVMCVLQDNWNTCNRGKSITAIAGSTLDVIRYQGTVSLQVCKFHLEKQETASYSMYPLLVFFITKAMQVHGSIFDTCFVSQEVFACKMKLNLLLWIRCECDPQTIIMQLKSTKTVIKLSLT